jgi:hypothetical protein
MKKNITVQGLYLPSLNRFAALNLISIEDFLEWI